jgi:muramoyltetrapeptide carboxypeptidase
VDAERLAAGETLLRGAGFAIRRRDDLLARRGYLAGDDARRAREFMELVADSDVAAILCARGGYGCDRIIGRLDAEAVRAAAKPLVGFSDVTALLLWQRRVAGLMGFHGPMLDRGDDLDPAALDTLIAQLTGTVQLPLVLRGTGRGGGAGRGRLTGGSLTLATASLGTAWEIDTRGGILLLEDKAEHPYRIDRMLQQLRAAGKLEHAAGFGIGDVSTCLDSRYGTSLPFGHVRANATWAMGARATIDGSSGEVRILERGVSRAT